MKKLKYKSQSLLVCLCSEKSKHKRSAEKFVAFPPKIMLKQRKFPKYISDYLSLLTRQYFYCGKWKSQAVCHVVNGEL